MNPTSKILMVLGLLAAMDTTHAEDKPPMDDSHMFDALNIMAVPIGDRGMILKDSNGCLWVAKNAKGVPQLVAIQSETSGKPLCEAPATQR